MITRLISSVLMTIIVAPTVSAADARIAIEVVTERGVQATAHRDWLQLLVRCGADDVRIRSHRAGDEPSLVAGGSEERPRYSVVGLLNAEGTLTLPSGRFNRRSADKLRDYLERLAADGAEGVTAELGAFGLTKKQTELVHNDLANPVGMATQGLPLADVLKAIDKATELKVRMDDGAWQVVRDAEPVADEVESLTIGSALAILFKRDGLVLVPTKERGEQVVLRIARTRDFEGETWPVGWKSDRRTSELAPAMMEQLNAEVDGFKLAEAMESIAPRIGVPVYWDHATLRAKGIDPATIDVKLERQRTRLGRVIDRLLFQARLRGELKVDEAGTVFYWISR